jgi:hypothetical protein
MAQANHVPSAIRVLITDARPRPSTNPVRAACAATAILAEHSSPFSSTSRQEVHTEDVLLPLSAHLSALADLNVFGSLDIRRIKHLPPGLEHYWTGALRPIGDTMARGSS